MLVMIPVASMASKFGFVSLSSYHSQENGRDNQLNRRLDRISATLSVIIKMKTMICKWYWGSDIPHIYASFTDVRENL